MQQGNRITKKNSMLTYMKVHGNVLNRKDKFVILNNQTNNFAIVPEA